MTRYAAYLLAATLVASAPLMRAQQPAPPPDAGPTTQALISVDSKDSAPILPSDITVKVNDKPVNLLNLTHVAPNQAQIALLIDDGLRESVGRQLGDIKHFITDLPPGTSIFVGYMQNGQVAVAKNFTTEHQDAADAVRIPFGSRGMSASPYFCLSEFVKHWQPQPGVAHIVLMITNGVDPYNGSVSPMNQDSPYVQAAVQDAQRAGVAVYSMYYSDAGMRGGLVSFSGQSYLAQLAEGTGGRTFFQGTGNPVSMAPFLQQFTHDISESYIATFDAPMSRDLLRLKVTTRRPRTKVYAPEEVSPPTMGEPTGR